jgi:hypothetical protein
MPVMTGLWKNPVHPNAMITSNTAVDDATARHWCI